VHVDAVVVVVVVGVVVVAVDTCATASAAIKALADMGMLLDVVGSGLAQELAADGVRWAGTARSQGRSTSW
jgi:hypothetical protein